MYSSEVPFSTGKVSASANISVKKIVVLNNCPKKTARSLEESVGVEHIKYITRFWDLRKCTYAFRRP